MVKTKICKIRIDKKEYIVDIFYYRRIIRLRRSISNMKKTIKEYDERIIIKNKYLGEIFEDIKNKKKDG